MKEEHTKQITNQLAHCFAFYGDKPDELMAKLEQLVTEWFCKGIEQGLIELMTNNCKQRGQ